MVKRTKLIFTLSISTAVLIIIIIAAVVINSPYYPGFESGLHYLSPDLSENRTIIRDSVYLSRKSEVKIVFELKNSYITFERDQYFSFINNVEIQIWSDKEYFSFRSDDLPYLSEFPDKFQIDIGSINQSGNYNIYINSDHAVNATYNIGVGIGNESKFGFVRKNVRDFY